MNIVAADGKIREMAMIDQRTFLMWLATIHETKVSEAARPTVVAYQVSAADALDAHFGGESAVGPAAPVTPLDFMRAAVAQFELVERRLDGVDKRLDVLESRAAEPPKRARVDFQSIDMLKLYADAVEFCDAAGMDLSQLYTANGHLKKTGKTGTARYKNYLGTTAKRLAEANGIEPVPTGNSAWGHANQWSAAVWMAAERMIELES